MKVTIEMDGMNLTMVRSDTEPTWQATAVDTMADERKETTRTLTDAQAAATAALVCGVDGVEPEVKLYEMVGGAWDNAEARPIP